MEEATSGELSERFTEGIEDFVSLTRPVVVFQTQQSKKVIEGLRERIEAGDNLLILEWPKFVMAKGEQRKEVDDKIKRMISLSEEPSKVGDKQLLVIKD